MGNKLEEKGWESLGKSINNTWVFQTFMLSNEQVNVKYWVSSGNGTYYKTGLMSLTWTYFWLSCINIYFWEKKAADMYRHVIKQPHGHQAARVATICICLHGMSSWPRF